MFLRGVASLQRVNIGAQPLGTAQAVLHFNISPQPLYHKNFELLKQNLSQFRADGYQVFILADSAKQTERLQSIFEEMQAASQLFVPVERTLHAGFQIAT